DPDKGEGADSPVKGASILFWVVCPSAILINNSRFQVKGGKKKAKRAALLSNLEPTDESDQEAVGRKSKKGPLSKEALAECEEFGREMEERATALAKKFGKKTRSIFAAASLSTLASRKESVWNMHQSWFFATQGQNDEDVDRLRARQKEHYEVLHDSEEGEEKWDIMRQYYIEMAAGVESGPKSSVGRVMAARDAFAKSLVPHGYVKRSILWKRLCHEAENLHFTILNWPEEIPVPDTQFDFHKLDANEVLKLLANFLIDRLGPMYKPEGDDDGENSKGKGKGKGKKGKGKAVEEPYVPQDGDDLAFIAWPRDVINIYRRGGPLAEAIPLVKSRICPDKASKILLTVGGLHGKKLLASIVDEHDKDVIDEEWPGLAVKDTGFRNADNSDSAQNAAHRANCLPPSTSDRDGCSIERPHSPSHHRVLDRPCSPHCHCSPPPCLPPPERRHSPHRPPDHLAPASRQKRGRIADDVDSNQFEEVVNTHERVLVVKRARVLPEEAGLHSADDDYH
ncbi:hypothetical protein PAXINDRAFT_18696, partial [Paxillus involutus ATCC 200175]